MPLNEAIQITSKMGGSCFLSFLFLDLTLFRTNIKFITPPVNLTMFLGPITTTSPPRTGTHLTGIFLTMQVIVTDNLVTRSRCGKHFVQEASVRLELAMK